MRMQSRDRMYENVYTKTYIRKRIYENVPTNLKEICWKQHVTRRPIKTLVACQEIVREFNNSGIQILMPILIGTLMIELWRQLV